MQAVLRHADAARLRVWRALARFDWARRCARDRAARTYALAVFHLAVALLLTLVAPLWLLLLGPLVLGVPHVVAGLRFLTVQRYGGPGLRWAGRLALPLGAMAGLRVVAMLGGPWLPEWELACGLTAVALARPRPAVLLGVAVLGALLLPHAELTALVVGHLHNLIAVALWFWLAGRTGRAGAGRWVVVGAFAVVFALLLTGGLAPIAGLAAPIAGFDMHLMVTTLAPGLDPTLGFRLVLAFAFAQAVHYAMWLRLTPLAVGRGPTAPTFARALRELVTDLGPRTTALVIGLTLLIPGLALADPALVRDLYLSAVLFHGWFELAAATRGR